MVACGTLPTPETGGMAGRPGVVDTGLDGVFAAGDWVGPTGHLADAALVSGEAAGRLAADRAAAATTGGAGAGNGAGSGGPDLGTGLAAHG